MSTTNIGLFRSALLFESAANISTIFPLLFAPAKTLEYLVKNTSDITPAAMALTQWFGGILVLATAPLLLSYPEPTSSQSPSVVTARRRLTYTIMGASEVALSAIMLGQYFAGDSGMTDTMLLVGTAMIGGFAGVRAFFLYAKPELMEAKSSATKSQ